MAALSGPLIVEGVCLRAVADRCGIPIHLHVYVRSISHNSGLWNDEDVGLAERPAEELKQERREMAEMASSLIDNYEQLEEDGDKPGGLGEELIDYHAEWKPYQRADVVYDVEDESIDTP